jgi:hypothetical protein
VQPPTAFDRALIVAVAAAAEVRAERLRLRSLDVVARGLTATDMLMAHDDGTMAANLDMLVQNHNATEVAVIDHFGCAPSRAEP